MGRPATLRVDLVTNAKTGGVDQAESRLGKFGSRAAKVGKVAGLGLAAVGAAALVAGKQVVDSASRQQQAYGALDSVFGKSAKRVKAWAATSASSVGLARAEYAELSSIIGAQLSGMGFATDKAAAKSRTLIKTGADLAATFGGSTKEAVEALSSVLKGETDPIERYGVSIKQADINAQLAAMGLDGLTGKAAKQAQAQAVLSLVTEQTTKAHGAFARESNTLAGQQERLRANFENVKATVGARLLPILTTLFGWINAKLLPGAARLGAEFQTRFGPIIDRVGAFVRDRLVPALRDLWGWFVNKIAPSIRSAVTPILNGVRSAFSQVTASVHSNSGSLSTLVRFIGRVIEASGPLRVLMGKTIGAAFRVAGFSISLTIGTISRLVDMIARAGSYIGWLIDKVRSLAALNPAKYLGKLGGLFAAGPLNTMVAPLTTGTRTLVAGPSLTVGPGLSTAAAGSALDLADVVTGGRNVQYVDARSFPVEVTVDGGLFDPRVLSQLERALRQHATRLGSTPAFERR